MSVFGGIADIARANPDFRYDTKRNWTSTPQARLRRNDIGSVALELQQRGWVYAYNDKSKMGMLAQHWWE